MLHRQQTPVTGSSLHRHVTAREFSRSALLTATLEGRVRATTLPRSIVSLFNMRTVHMCTDDTLGATYNLEFLGGQCETLLSTHAFGAVQLHDTRTHRAFHRFKAHTDGVNVAKALGDSVFATGGEDCFCRVWDVRDLRRELTVCPVPLRHEHWVKNIEMSSDRQWFLTCAFDETLRCWPINGNEGEPIVIEVDRLCRAVLSPDGTTLVLATRHSYLLTIRNLDIPSLRYALSPAKLRDCLRRRLAAFDERVAEEPRASRVTPNQIQVTRLETYFPTNDLAIDSSSRFLLARQSDSSTTHIYNLDENRTLGLPLVLAVSEHSPLTIADDNNAFIKGVSFAPKAAFFVSPHYRSVRIFPFLDGLTTPITHRQAPLQPRPIAFPPSLPSHSSIVLKAEWSPAAPLIAIGTLDGHVGFLTPHACE